MELSENANDYLYPLNKLKRDLNNIQLQDTLYEEKNKSKESDSNDLDKTNIETLPDLNNFMNQITIDKNLTTFALKSSVSQIQYDTKKLNEEKRLRQSYMDKLISKQVWSHKRQEENKKQYNSLTIFDWDDTLFCTTFLSCDGEYDKDVTLSDQCLEKITQLESLVYRLLSLALNEGDVYIISNSDYDWIKYTSEKHYPNIKPLLAKIKIISARGLFEAKYPYDNRIWKIKSFLQLKQYYNTDKLTNIVSLGDSNIEMEAAHVLGTQFIQASVKTVKFREYPTIEEIIKELKLVIQQFNKIHFSAQQLSIKIEKK